MTDQAISNRPKDNSLVTLLVDRFISPAIQKGIVPNPADVAHNVFRVLDALEREQIVTSLAQEIRVIDLGRAEIASAVERRVTSQELSALCLGLGTLLWQVGDLRCVSFGLRNMQMAKNLSVAALNDDSIGRYLKMLSEYREVAAAVLREKVALIGRPLTPAEKEAVGEAEGSADR